jgi:hypothetical protein
MHHDYILLGTNWFKKLNMKHYENVRTYFRKCTQNQRSLCVV